jgi:FecR protein
LASKWPRRPDLLARWSRAAIPVKAVAEDPARRARLVGAVVRAMEGATVERSAWRPARWQVALAAVAVALLVAVGAWRGSTAIGRLAGGGRSLIGDSHALDRDGGVFSSPNESSSGLRLPSGVVVATGPRTRFEVPDVSALSNTREEIVIESGLLRVEVPRLPAGHVFAVRTPDTLVTVHGTSFSVEVTRVGPSGVPTTKVAVTHGVVSVLHASRETLLYGGMEWTSAEPDSVAPAGSEAASLAAGPSGPAPVTTDASAESRTAPRGEPDVPSKRDAGRHPSGPAPAAREVRPAPKPATETVDLANQNILFAQAKQARAQGDDSRAIGLLSDLVRLYPASPLAEDAHVEIFRALAHAGDRAGAAREARRYLTLYRDGFARDEARSTALEPSSAP